MIFFCVLRTSITFLGSYRWMIIPIDICSPIIPISALINDHLLPKLGLIRHGPFRRGSTLLGSNTVTLVSDSTFTIWPGPSHRLTIFLESAWDDRLGRYTQTKSPSECCTSLKTRRRTVEFFSWAIVSCPPSAVSRYAVCTPSLSQLFLH